MRQTPMPAVLVLGLAACSGPTPDARTAACREQALSDPAVIAAIERANSPLQQVRLPGVEAQQRAIDRAVQQCLGGPARRGGVEAVEPP